ncbi:MAG: hypothetical protein C0594_05415 [Marinilabiliales bacterium]|nr:MAG: hypothetical protein C0594_05415 [Marinilabiliales bacterium]
MESNSHLIANSPSVYGVRDLRLRATSPSISLGARVYLYDPIWVKGSVNIGYLSGDDNYLDRSRNLSFRTPIIETALQLGVKYRNISLFAGIGAFYFNPMAKYDGQWYSLRESGTGGQGLAPTRSKYDPIGLCLPLGFSYDIEISDNSLLSISYGFRFTNTDYIDDVSTTYYENDLLKQSRGDVAAALGDRTPELDGGYLHYPNETRGNPKTKDRYMFFGIEYCFFLKTTDKK